LKKAAEDLFESRSLPRSDAARTPPPIEEKLTKSVNDIPVETTLHVIREMDMYPERMSQDERRRVVAALDRRGVFLLKGAIASVARALQASEATIYRYLRQVRENGE
ncbi:MAG: helix-turn-helix domain-containing protein, partial [Spirochaetales bacterium]|nr:helix-turn-helix domain-containing protein [Spirochaetales bacterium]